MEDPLQLIFGMPARQLFEQAALTATHGPLERFPHFMREGALTSVDALCRDYTGPVEVAQGTAEQGVQLSVSGAHPWGLLRAGLTVFFSDLRRSAPGSTPWLRALEASLGLPQCASVLAFANAAGSGLTLHHDKHDQLFFQLQGEKVFRYAPNRYVENPDLQFSPANAALEDFGQRYQHGFPLTSREVLSGELETLSLRPGSAFFMPGGTWHTTAEQAGESLSLVVAVRAPSQLDLLLNLLRYYGGQAPPLRARSYGAWSSDPAERAAASAAWSDQLTELAARLTSLPAEAAHAAWCVQGVIKGTLGDYPEHLRFERFIRLPSSSITFGELTPEGKLSCSVLSGPNHRPQNRTLLGIHPEAREVVAWITQQNRAFSREEACEACAEFDPTDVAELLSWLTRAGLLRPLPAPAW
jgi:Cupin superfamily protein